jgi:hypothetical protein
MSGVSFCIDKDGFASVGPSAWNHRAEFIPRRQEGADAFSGVSAWQSDSMLLK